MTTAHERYEAQVTEMPKETTWQQLDGDRLNFENAQKAAIIAERDDLRLQVAALVAERNALRAMIAEWNALLDGMRMQL